MPAISPLRLPTTIHVTCFTESTRDDDDDDDGDDDDEHAMSLVANAVCDAGLLLLPAYYTYKELRRGDHVDGDGGAGDGVDAEALERRQDHLKHWVVAAAFSVFQAYLEWTVNWLPLFVLMKMLFVFWLVSPGTQGSVYLYDRWVSPFLLRHEDVIDEHLEHARARSQQTLRHYAREAAVRLGDVATVVTDRVRQFIASNGDGRRRRIRQGAGGRGAVVDDDDDGELLDFLDDDDDDGDDGGGAGGHDAHGRGGGDGDERGGANVTIRRRR